VKVTRYFETSVMAYLKTEWIEQVLSNPIHTVVQSNGRICRWGYIAEANKYLRVITGETVHNAFFDRRFRSEK
jgi:hypothetical protein